MFGSLLGKPTKVFGTLILSGLMLAMTFTANIGTIQSASAASAGDRVTDFNGDGFEDLAIGVPRESIGSGPISVAGAVNVIHGSSVGISATPDIGSSTGLADQVWTQNSPNVQGVAYVGEFFGHAVAAGDFNNDGYSDIAIGARSDQTNPSVRGGSVNVIYGSAGAGLDPTGALADQIFTQNSPNILGVAATDDYFGQTLTVGDFNGDGYDDLAIGVPGEDITTPAGLQESAGAVNIIYGSSEGLSALKLGDGNGNNNQIWSQNTLGILDTSENSDFFGSALTSGDFNNDGFDDLAIGAPGEGNFVPSNGAGAVNIIYGSPTGLSGSFVQNQFFQLGSSGIDGTSSDGDQFGYALASADFDDDGFDDLAIGAPNEFVKTCDTCPSHSAGVVSVVYGTSAGLSATSRPDDRWHQSNNDNGEFLEGSMSSQDLFGSSLTAGDFNDDGFDDLAIGVLQDSVSVDPANGVAGGAVNVVYGSPDGLSQAFVPDQLFSQNSPFVEETAANGDDFGHALAAGDYNGDGFVDLVIGVFKEDVFHDSIIAAGAVHVIYGSSEGLSAVALGDGTGRPDQLWTQNSPNVNDVSEENDFFGWSLG